MSDGYTWTADNRPRRAARLSLDRDGKVLDLTVDEPTPEQVTEMLLAWSCATIRPEREDTQ